MQAEHSNEVKNKPAISKNLKDILVDFEIFFPIGRGTNSFVYKALYIPKKKIVALKVIECKSDKIKEQVRREIKIQQSLDHPNVVKLYDYFYDESNYYLVLEYCSKGEIYTHFQQYKKKLNESEIRTFGKQALLALAHVHSRGIVHRDIKMGNLLLSENKELKLADFGLSIELSESQKLKNETFSGTPNYLSPELLQKNKICYANDLWSLGCVLYAMTFGDLPFEGPDYKSILKNIVNKSINFKDDCTDQLKSVLKVLLDKNHEVRKKASKILEMDFFRSAPKEDLTSTTMATNRNTSSIDAEKTNLEKESNTWLFSQTAKQISQKISSGNKLFGSTFTSDRNISLKKTCLTNQLDQMTPQYSCLNLNERPKSTIKSRLDIGNILEVLNGRYNLPIKRPEIKKFK